MTSKKNKLLLMTKAGRNAQSPAPTEIAANAITPNAKSEMNKAGTAHTTATRNEAKAWFLRSAQYSQRLK